MLWQFVALGVIVAATVLVVLWGSNRAAAVTPAPPPPPDRPEPEVQVALDTTPDRPMSFGYNIAWFAVQSLDAQGIVEALGLTSPRPANWQSGLCAAYEEPRCVFLTPPVEGWTLVIGQVLPDPGGEGRPDRCTPVLLELARRFPRVCYFSTYGRAEIHAWALAEHGRLLRQFAWIGETGECPWDSDPLTAEERQLGLHFARHALPAGDDAAPGEDDVLALAAHWSLDVTCLESANAGLGIGAVCAVSEKWV